MDDVSIPRVESDRPVFLEAIVGALGRVPLWLVFGLLPAIPALALSAVWHQGMHSAMHQRVEPGEQVASLTAPFQHDHGQMLQILREGTSSALLYLGLVALLLGIFTAGGWLQIFLERTRGHSLRRFLYGGARYFFRFLRVAVLVVLLLAAVEYLVVDSAWSAWVDRRLFGVVDGDVEALASESAALWRTWSMEAAHFLLFSLVLVWGDFTRTRMALQDASSALLTGLSSFWLLLRHPIRTLRPMVLIFLVEALMLAAIASAAVPLNRGLDTSSTLVPVAILFALSIAALLGREIFRATRYHAAVQVTADLLRKPSGDPYKQSLGGPGGPRYPIGDDDGDEFGVSL